MSEEIKTEALPQAEEIKGEENLAKPEAEPPADIFIPVKFNKEMRNLKLEEAAGLAQKGLKYEAIEKDYALLRELAAKDQKSVPEFLNSLFEGITTKKLAAMEEKCGGDRALAQHILELEEKTVRDSGFEELKEYFPEIQATHNLPESVVEASKLKGTLLLDEYLRYLLAQNRESKAALLTQRNAEKASTGSLMNRKGANSPETEEFLKGLWK